MTTNRWKSAAVIIGAALCAVTAGAESPWRYTVTPYAWLAGLDGDVGARGITVPVEEDFSDLLDKLSVAAMLGGEAHNGTWGVYADGIYMDLDDDETTAIGKVEAELEQWLVSAGALLRVIGDDKKALDVGAGGRYIDTDIDITTSLGDASESKNWIDPLVVGRLRLQVAERCFVQLAGDIGGFGVESDLVWQLTGSAGYEITETVSAFLGYRHLDYDYEQDDIVYDVATSGFGLGLSIAL